jgi:hypothetical protein
MLHDSILIAGKVAPSTRRLPAFSFAALHNQKFMQFWSCCLFKQENELTVALGTQAISYAELFAVYSFLIWFWNDYPISNIPSVFFELTPRKFIRRKNTSKAVRIPAVTVVCLCAVIKGCKSCLLKN